MEWLSQWLPVISFVVSIITGPVVMAALNAIHERKTSKLIEDALEKEKKSMEAVHAGATSKIIEDALDKERERSKELFALKHEVAEMKGHVMQLVSNTNSLDAKLDKMADLLMQMQRAR